MSSDPVILIDGDPAVRDSLSTLLDLNGYVVETFSTGAAFLKWLKAGVKMNCVVCESELPDTTGIRIFESVRSIDARTPFALLVSTRDPTVIQQATAAGIKKVFQKPLVHRRLIEFVSSGDRNNQASSVRR